jgi:hypothetical protein
MGFLDRVFGASQSPGRSDRDTADRASDDERAIARYRYLLRTAPPAAIEQAHAEAFAQLTPEQRVQVLGQLGRELPAGERVDDPRRADPQTLARLATRAEMRRPGTLERSFGGVGMGGLVAGSLLSTIAGTFIGTAIAHQFLGGFGAGEGHDPGAAEAAEAEATEAEAADADLEGDVAEAGDPGGGDFGGGDFGDA